MLHILWVILKIILYILLGILGLLLALILVVLIVPIRYGVDVKYGDTVRLQANVRFLVVSARILYDRESKEKDVAIRLFGIRLFKSKPEPVKDRAEKVEQEEKLVSESDKWFNAGEPTEAINDEEAADTPHDNVSADEIFDDNASEVEIEKKSILDKLEELSDAFDDLIDRTEHKYDKKRNMLRRRLKLIEKYWHMSCTEKSRRYIARYIPGVIRHILPRKIKGYIRYGFEDPSQTGMITGYLSLLPFVYQKNFYITPDFYNKVLEADFFAKGRIQLGYIVRIVLNINIWKTIKATKALMNKMGGN